MTEKLNIGVLGCANIARKYAIHAFKANESVDKVYVSSRDVSKCKAWSEEFQIEYSDSYENMIKAEDIHAIYIPLPIGLHEEWVIKAAEAHKHILCEKSLADNYIAVKRMVDTCKTNNVVLFENFMCDYHPQHSKVLDLINAGELGEIFTIRSYFGFPPLDRSGFRYNKQLGGGSLNDAGAYTGFISRKIFGIEPLAATCNLQIDPESGVDIRGSGFIEFPEDKSALVSFGFNNVYQNNYSVWGTKGTITVNRAFSIPPNLKPPIELYKNENFKETFEEVDAPSANHFELIFDDFCKTILTNDTVKMNEKNSQILHQARLMEAMRMSAKQSQRIKLEDVK
jgi:predicted dehydrogenase